MSPRDYRIILFLFLFLSFEKQTRIQGRGTEAHYKLHLKKTVVFDFAIFPFFGNLFYFLV